MKKINKICTLLIISWLIFYNKCFADLIGFPNEPTYPKRPIQSSEAIIYWPGVFISGLLVLIVVTCAIIIIKKLIKNKNEKERESKNG